MLYDFENIFSFLLIGVGFTVVFLSQMYLSSTYAEMKKVKNKKRMTGCEIAREILDDNGLTDIYVVEIPGKLSDYYDPFRKVVRLSKDVFHGDTIASLAVSAQVCSYALQDKENNHFMRIRSNFLPFLNVLVFIGYFGIIASLLLVRMHYLRLSIALLLVVVLVHLISLPIELDASKKASRQLEKLLLVDENEKQELENMLKAMVFIYIASIYFIVPNFIQNLRER